MPYGSRPVGVRKPRRSELNLGQPESDLALEDTK